MAEINEDTYYSSIMSLREMHMVILLAELNNLEMCASDFGNAYLDEYTNEKMFSLLERISSSWIIMDIQCLSVRHFMG